MSYQNSSPVPDPDNSISAGFNAQSQMGLPEVLQMCCLSRRSGQITFRSGESYGYIFIQHGKVLHAMCGPLEGEDAIYTMLLWPGGGFSLNEDILPHKKTVTLTWEQLLFEGARRADEGVVGTKLQAGVPVTTAAPLTSSRTKDSQPKLTITRPDLPPVTHELVQEFTHVGRVQGNDLTLPYPSVSSRHCVFILSGPDVVLRDLNSSNGTLVNREVINEVVVRPGDVIQIGVVEMKFEAGIKRPKLSANVPEVRPMTEHLSNKESTITGITTETVKLPNKRSRRITTSGAANDNTHFVSGQSAISYENLAKPEREEKKLPTLVIVIALVALVLVSIACYFIFLR